MPRNGSVLLPLVPCSEVIDGMGRDKESIYGIGEPVLVLNTEMLAG